MRCGFSPLRVRSLKGDMWMVWSFRGIWGTDVSHYCNIPFLPFPGAAGEDRRKNLENVMEMVFGESLASDTFILSGISGLCTDYSRKYEYMAWKHGRRGEFR